MRLDLFLKSSRLIVRRSLAQKFCDANLVSINNVVAKSSREVKVADEIEIRRHDRLTRAKVLKIPEKRHVLKTEAASLFEIILDERLEDDLFETS